MLIKCLLQPYIRLRRIEQHGLEARPFVTREHDGIVRAHDLLGLP